MSIEDNEEKSQQPPVDPWTQYQQEQTKIWLSYWTGVLNKLFNTDLRK